MTDWVILRTAGRSTLPLAKSLAGAGYEVWTPIERLTKRRPRTRACDELRVPMTPTYVFARARHIYELIALAANPGRNHDGFSVFRNDIGVPLIADRSLDGLRAHEETAERRQQEIARRRQGKLKGDSYAIGETVRIPDGSFAGMDGMVEDSDPRNTMVLFGGSLRLKISTFILRQNGVRDSDSPLLGAAA